MRYEDALKIGTSVEGYVRCTYAKLHDVKGGFLYALQRGDFYNKSAAHEQASEALGITTDEIVKAGTDYVAFVEDMPVVKAVGAGHDEKHVEVQLTPYCQSRLYAQAKKRKSKDHIAEILSKNTTFMVKECAIDWFPTNIDAVVVTDKDGKTVTLNVALEKAKKRLDQAKAILAAAGTFAII